MRGALLLLPLLLLVGCQGGGASSLGNRQVANDPLKGIGGPSVDLARVPQKDPYAATVGNGIGSPSRPAGPLPSLPTPTGSTSPAALTSGSTSTLDPAPALRIGGGGNVSTVPDSAWSGPGETPKNSFQSAPSDPLKGPTNDVAPAVTIPPLTLTSHRAGTMSLGDLMREVEKRGAIQPKLSKNLEGEWVFSCRLQNLKNASLVHWFEVAADTDTAALQAALEQIDAELKAQKMQQ
jgi:hypothetical protein